MKNKLWFFDFISIKWYSLFFFIKPFFKACTFKKTSNNTYIFNKRFIFLIYFDSIIIFFPFYSKIWFIVIFCSNSNYMRFIIFLSFIFCVILWKIFIFFVDSFYIRNMNFFILCTSFYKYIKNLHILCSFWSWVVK